MTLHQRFLDPLRGSQVGVVMTDGRAFRGRLEDVDDRWAFLADVVEGTTTNVRGWEEATATMDIVEKEVTFQGIMRRDGDRTSAVYRMKDVLVNLSGVLRVWEWSDRNLERASRVTDVRPLGVGTPRAAAPASVGSRW